MKTLLSGLSTNELESLAVSGGFPAYRGRQLAEWLYMHGITSFADMKNLPAKLRESFADNYDASAGTVITVSKGNDGTAKLLIELRDGIRVETVALPYEDRFSVCVSTQAGCAVGCLFCASGRDGLVRNLGPGEIIGQVLAVRGLIESGDIPTTEQNRRIDHVVFMGMGEPLLNYDATLKAVHLLNNEMGIAARNLTVSTVGIVPEMLRLAEEKLQITLAVSLHAPNDTLRQKLVPGVTAWKIADIIDACRTYIDITGRRITFEYCMLDGINDGEAEAKELTSLLTGLNCHVNLIRFNAVPKLDFLPSSGDKVRAFRNILEASRIQVTQRMQRGAGIAAACGQLRQNMKSRQD